MSLRRTPQLRVMGERLGLLFAVAMLVAAAWSSPADAHAQLESSSPAAGSVVAVSPAKVVLRFDDAVEVDFGSIRVFNASGARVDDGGTHHLGGDDHTVAIDLPPRQPDGAYVVAWRVISDDSHPVHGAFVFSVGTSRGLASASALAEALANASGGGVVGATYGAVRFASFAGLLALVGTAGVALFAAPWSLPTSRVRRALWTSWWLLVVATVAGICVQGVYAAALPLADALHGSLVREVLATRFGRVAVLRLSLLACSVPLLVHLCSRRRGPTRPGPAPVIAAVLVGAGLLATPALAGHASTGSAIAAGFVLDLCHLAASSAWVGGLVVLACLLVRAPAGAGDATASTGQDSRDVSAATSRVSSLLVVAVGVVVLSGSLQAIRQVGRLPALFGTDYGRLLLLKVGVVAVLIALGVLSRSLVRRSAAPARGDGVTAPRRRLARSVVAELCVVAVVLGITAALVNAPPAREQFARPYEQSFTTLGVQVNVTVSPAAAGIANTLHVYVLSLTGAPKAVPEVDATVRSATTGAGPVAVPLTLAGVGHYRSRHVRFSTPGLWLLGITVRTEPNEQQTTTLRVPVH